MADKVILCVDDERTILNGVKNQLKKRLPEEYTIELAESADEALEIIEEMVSDSTEILIIVSDWLMPGMKGDEFLIEVHKRFPAIIKVMLTGQADEEAIERAKKDANLFKLLGKPWNEDELVATILSGLEGGA